MTRGGSGPCYEHVETCFLRPDVDRERRTSGSLYWVVAPGDVIRLGCSSLLARVALKMELEQRLPLPKSSLLDRQQVICLYRLHPMLLPKTS